MYESEHEFSTLAVTIYLKKRKSGKSIGLYKISGNLEISRNSSSLKSKKGQRKVPNKRAGFRK